MVVTAVAVNLAADLAARPGGAVDVHISGAGTNCLNQLVNFAGIQSLISRGQSCWDVGTYVGCEDRTRYRGGRCGAGLNSRRTVAQIGTKEDADAAVHTNITDVDMSLLDSAFKIGVTEFPVNSRFIIADAGVKGSTAGGRDRRNLLISGQKLADFFEALAKDNR